MTAERMFKEYKNLKKEQGILLFQLEQFSGIEESDVIDSMMFGHADDNDRVQTSNRSDKTASVAINYKSVMDRENDEWFEFLWNRYQAVVEELKFFEHSVASLDGILPELVMDLVRGELTWETMEQKYNVSHAMIGKYRKVHPVLTPERMEKRQNGRRMKEDGEPMFTLTSQDRHGVYFCEKPVKSVKVKNATKTGYEEAHLGDGIVLAYPNSDTRRGRVGKGCSQTLDTRCQMGTLMRCGRIRRLTPKECFRLQGFPDELYERAASVNSDSQLYKQAGNAVTATVAYALAMCLPESQKDG